MTSLFALELHLLKRPPYSISTSGWFPAHGSFGDTQNPNHNSRHVLLIFKKIDLRLHTHSSLLLSPQILPFGLHRTRRDQGGGRTQIRPGYAEGSRLGAFPASTSRQLLEPTHLLVDF